MMKYFVIILTILSGVFISKTNCNGQQLVSTSGSIYAGQAWSISSAIGEILTTTLSSNESVITQGMHQPNLTVTSIYEQEMFAYRFTVYPNPVSDFLTIRADNFDESYNLVLFDNSGKMIFNRKCQKGFDRQTLSFEGLKQGVYFMQIIDMSGTRIQTFKIVKI